MCWKEAKVLQLTGHRVQEIQGIRPHVSDRSSGQSTQLGYLSHRGCRYRRRNKKCNSPMYKGQNCFYVGTIQAQISPILVTLMMEAISSFKMSVLTRATLRNIPEDGILHSDRRENLKSYISLTSWPL
jgi:hypothetical protein